MKVRSEGLYLYLQVDLHTGPESWYTACRYINEQNKQTSINITFETATCTETFI